MVKLEPERKCYSEKRQRKIAAPTVKFRYAVPACTDLETFRNWLSEARRAPPKHGFCEDCTPEFQQKMRAAGRCENPHVRFAVDGDGLQYGYPTYFAKDAFNES